MGLGREELTRYLANEQFSGTHSPNNMCAKPLSHVLLFMTLWTVAHQAPLSMEFPRQEYWSGLPFLSPGDLPNPGIELASLVSPALASAFLTTEPPGKPHQTAEMSNNGFNGVLLSTRFTSRISDDILILHTVNSPHPCSQGGIWKEIKARGLVGHLCRLRAERRAGTEGRQD